jgi:hypothetical protein
MHAEVAFDAQFSSEVSRELAKLSAVAIPTNPTDATNPTISHRLAIRVSALDFITDLKYLKGCASLPGQCDATAVAYRAFEYTA